MIQVLKWLVAVACLAHAVRATDCSAEQDQTISDAYASAAATSACAQYSTTGSVLISISPPCTATDCLTVLEQLAESIPNCSPGSSTESEHDLLEEFLDECAPTPASTASTTNCTSSQAESTVSLFLQAAQGDACSSDAKVSSSSIFISASCNSTCGSALQNLATALPNCQYELAYSNTNVKSDLATDLSTCDIASSSLVSAILYVDENEQAVTSSTGSSSLEAASASSSHSSTAATTDTPTPTVVVSSDIWPGSSSSASKLMQTSVAAVIAVWAVVGD